MFEYYKWRLANKPVGKPSIKIDEKEPLKQRVWVVMVLFAVSLAMASSLATFWGMPVFIFVLVIAGVSFVWLILELLNVTIKDVRTKLLEALAFLIGAGLVWGLIFGMVNWLAHVLLGDVRHRGQITSSVEVVMWLALIAIAPVMIVLFFRLMDGRNVFEKIRRQVYFELLITLVVGAVLTYFPNIVILSTLFSTRLVQFILLAMINTGLLAGLITTCRNRGVL